MSRSLAQARRLRRVTQPIAIVQRPRDPAIDDLGFRCYRLVPTYEPEAPYAPLVVERSGAAMFVFARRG